VIRPCAAAAKADDGPTVKASSASCFRALGDRATHEKDLA
jgi:hypothetical protein